MNTLQKIIIDKKKNLELLKRNFPITKLEKSSFFERKTYSMKEFLLKRSGIISEFKRKSPSKSDINIDGDVIEITKGYQLANSSGVSILTDEAYFGGKKYDFSLCRDHLFIPMLRKDFIIDEYQIIESKSIGSDIILLIASCLTTKEIKRLSKIAKSLDLEVLLEVHSEEELNNSLNENIDIIGVNNRNLKLFETDITISIDLSSAIPKEFCKISESGISTSKQIDILKNCGYDGFLIGEKFMKSNDPSKACLKFIQSLND